MANWVIPSASAVAGITAAVARFSRRPKSRTPLGDGEHPERRDDGQPEQAVGDVVVVDVGQLVGDDQARLGRVEVLDQVVVEHDALGPLAGDVGVGGRRPARASTS